ncbi:MAG TPA: MauE/DoxX family redox-associated membrane protein [Gaiellaceae bacterium]|jgi:hypothetical protein|nr:MauE/DoxX family redox-associated membrane protein [Gaiellaceae bacterium]
MSVVLLAAGRGILAVVLLASGGAKLGDLTSFAGTLRALGAPERQARPFGALVATVEAALGFALLTGAAVRAVDVAVLALTTGFAAVTVYAVRTRPGLRCRCFGALTESRFGRYALVRTLALVALAAVVVAADGRVDLPSAPGGAGAAFTLAGGALFAIACAQAARTLDLVQRRRP